MRANEMRQDVKVSTQPAAISINSEPLALRLSVTRLKHSRRDNPPSLIF